MVDILKGMDVSLCVFMAGIVAFVIAVLLYLFLWETWSNAYEEDLEEETIEYYMIYTVWSNPAAIAEHRDGIRISKGDAKLYYVMKTVQVENL